MHKATVSRESGFTVIELMIVMLVLGVLAGVVLLTTAGIDDSAEAGGCASEVRTVRSANLAYRYLTGSDAGDVDTLVSGGYLDAEPAYVTFADGVTNPSNVEACS